MNEKIIISTWMSGRMHERMGRWLNGRMAMGRDTKVGLSHGSVVEETQTRGLILSGRWQCRHSLSMSSEDNLLAERKVCSFGRRGTDVRKGRAERAVTERRGPHGAEGYG